MTSELTAVLAEGLGDNNVTTVIGAGVFSMLVALFTLFMRAVLATGKRADTRADAELERTRADLAAERAVSAHWQNLYLDMLQKRDPQ